MTDDPSPAPIVLVAGYVASDRVPDRIAAMGYVDTAPAPGALGPDFEGVEMPLPPQDELEREENLDGLTQEQLDTFRLCAVPERGGVVRGVPTFTNAARRDVPSTIICNGFSSQQVHAAMTNGHGWLGGLAELRDVTWVDLPTSHRPMWSRPAEPAQIMGDIAARAGA